MCGIAGFIDVSRSKNGNELTQNINVMTQAIAYRGPDGHGSWVDPENGVALGHRRLAILDLTAAGFQPMQSQDKRFILTYNGEIYNSFDIKNNLSETGATFKGHSDTEVMLAAFCVWGIVKSLEKMVGMFAFALWDTQEKSLWLGRDRLGKKPLYYGWNQSTFIFASDLNALRASPVAGSLTIDRSALTSFHQWAFIPSPYCLYQGIQKLTPGTVRLFKPHDFASFTLGTEETFWSFKDVVQTGLKKRNQEQKTFNQAVQETKELLQDAVQCRMMADVPLGGFLSGGIDSSLIAALMQQYSAVPIKTFAVGFEENSYDESKHAEKIASYLETDHQTIMMTPEKALAIIDRLPEIYDEPFGDTSQLPTVLVARLASASVKVVLSGDGGDEVFAGYNRYLMSEKIKQIFKMVPYALRKIVAKILYFIPVKFWRMIEPLVFVKHLENKISKIIPLLQQQNFEQVYEYLLKRWQPFNEVFKNSLPHLIAIAPFNSNNGGHSIDWMQYHDTLRYLNDDILVKVDRATMAESIEARCPFLDHRLIEYAWSLPLNYKISHGKGKLILRKILNQYIPEELFERPKMGFGVPIDAWLRGPLKEWANHLFNPAILEERGYNSAFILQQWQAHCQGQNRGDDLWMVLMAQLWENRLTKCL